MRDPIKPASDSQYRPPPADTDAEMATLGSMLLDASMIDAVLAVLPDAEAFFDAEHRTIYRAIQSLRDGGLPMDIVVFEDYLRERGELEKIGGRDYLLTLSESAPAACNAAYYAEIVADKWHRRLAISAAVKLENAVHDEDGDFASVAASVAVECSRIAEPSGNAANLPSLTRLSDVEPEAISWLWPGRFPLGKLSLVVGDPCVGKSFTLCDIASRVSTGAAWPDRPDEPREPGTVVMLTAEDGLADTIRPRIDRLAGDPSRIHVLTGIPEPGQSDRMFSLARDLGALERAITTTDARLVVIDPLSAYLGGADSHRDAEVRSVLAPLAALAEKHRTAIIGIMHLGKDSGRRAAYRTNGSIAFTAAPRAVWAVAEDHESQGRRIVVNVKLNVAEAADGIGYRIIDGAVAWDSEPVSITADEALGNRPADGDGAGSEAEAFLRDALAEGPVRASEIRRVAREAGIAKRTLARAKDRLGIRSDRVGFGGDGQWLWTMPDSAEPAMDATESPKDAIECHTGERHPMAPYGENTQRGGDSDDADLAFPPPEEPERGDRWATEA